MDMASSRLIQTVANENGKFLYDSGSGLSLYVMTIRIALLEYRLNNGKSLKNFREHWLYCQWI